MCVGVVLYHFGGISTIQYYHTVMVSTSQIWNVLWLLCYNNLLIQLILINNMTVTNNKKHNTRIIKLFLNQVCIHSWPKASCGCLPGLLKLFSEKCVCLYICLSFRTHVNKILFTKNSLYGRNKGHVEPVVNFRAGKLRFKAVNTC